MKRYLLLLLLFTGLHYGSFAQDIHFTVKPLCDRKVLRLSLIYDLVVKGYGRIIDVNTQEGEYTEFMVIIPLKEI